MAHDPICGMQISEKKGFFIDANGEKVYFCGESCAQKWCQENHVSVKKIQPPNNQKSIYLNKNVLVILSLMVIIGASLIVPILAPLRKSLFSYLHIIWWPVLVGLLIGGLIDFYIPRQYISVILAKPGKRTIFNAVGLGFLMSACSHGILAIAIQLYKKGASIPAVISFLLASPWANLPLTILLFGFFGLKALVIIFGAIIIAILTGFFYQFLVKHKWLDSNPNSLDVEVGFSIRKDLKKRFSGYRFSIDRLKSDLYGIYKGSLSLANMVLWWILLGIGIASMIQAYMPSHFFQEYMGPHFLGLGVTLLVATLIEVCSEGSAPMAFEIYKQTHALGNTFIFLMAGVVTDYTEIGLIWHNVGRKPALWLPVITVPQVFVLSWLLNYIL